MKFLGKQSCVGIGCVAAGFLAGTVGKLILTSKDAKKVYTHCTAAVLRVKDKTTGKSTAAVLIAEVNGSNAKAAGLKKGDQIISVDNEKVSTAEGVISAIQSHRIGETVKLGIIRDGKEMTVSVKLQSSAEIKK